MISTNQPLALLDTRIWMLLPNNSHSSTYLMIYTDLLLIFPEADTYGKNKCPHYRDVRFILCPIQTYCSVKGVVYNDSQCKDHITGVRFIQCPLYKVSVRFDYCPHQKYTRIHLNIKNRRSIFYLLRHKNWLSYSSFYDSLILDKSLISYLIVTSNILRLSDKNG